MAKVDFKPGNMLYPLPAVLVTVRDQQGNDNVLTIGWAGTICSDPAMVSISVRPQRHSYHMLKETGEFVINLTTRDLAFATDYCGVKSGRNEDKFEALHLTKLPGKVVKAPLIAESPVNIECRVTQSILLGTHEMFMAKVVAVTVDDAYMDEKNTFHLQKADPIVYSHGEYYTLHELLGTFGYSVRKTVKKKAKRKATGKQNG